MVYSVFGKKIFPERLGDCLSPTVSNQLEFSYKSVSKNPMFLTGKLALMLRRMKRRLIIFVEKNRKKWGTLRDTKYCNIKSKGIDLDTHAIFSQISFFINFLIVLIAAKVEDHLE